MDVSDLKGLYGEVNKRMGAAIDHVRHDLKYRPRSSWSFGRDPGGRYIIVSRKREG